MITYISILRGINVSGHRQIKMDALKKLCTTLDFENIHTYIQSGNIVFNHKEKSDKKISSLLETAIEKSFGFNVPVITIASSEFENIVKSNPFIKDKAKDSSFFHITFLSDNPEKENIESLKQAESENENYKIAGKAIYLYCPDGYSNSKYVNTFWENKLKVAATTRNWKTVNKLLAIANQVNR